MDMQIGIFEFVNTQNIICETKQNKMKKKHGLPKINISGCPRLHLYEKSNLMPGTNPDKYCYECDTLMCTDCVDLLCLIFFFLKILGKINKMYNKNNTHSILALLIYNDVRKICVNYRALTMPQRKRLYRLLRKVPPTDVVAAPYEVIA